MCEEERTYDRSIYRTSYLGGGYIGPENRRTTNIPGYSFTMYPGNTHNSTYFGDALHLGDTFVYLYRGSYNNTYGTFYLTRNYYNNDRAFMQIYDKELGEYTANLKGIIISPSPNCLSELINSPDTAQYFDVIPDSWLSYIQLKIFNIRYNLCFISQSEVESFLNTHWRYTPNK